MSYVPTIPYADLAYATAYFGDRLSSSAWTGAPDDPTRLQALKQATRAIDNLNFAGEKHDEDWTNGVANQPRQFPRGNDTDVPDPVIQACCELALALLDGVDPDIEAENLGRSSQGTGEAKVTRDTSYTQEHVRAGIPSILAWNLLIPFMLRAQHPGINLIRGG